MKKSLLADILMKDNGISFLKMYATKLFFFLVITFISVLCLFCLCFVCVLFCLIFHLEVKLSLSASLRGSSSKSKCFDSEPATSIFVPYC